MPNLLCIAFNQYLIYKIAVFFPSQLIVKAVMEQLGKHLSPVCQVLLGDKTKQTSSFLYVIGIISHNFGFKSNTFLFVLLLYSYLYVYFLFLLFVWLLYKMLYSYSLILYIYYTIYIFL